MLEPVTKWNQRGRGRRAPIPEIVRKAFRVARLEKPGPTHIELPENLAATEVDDDARPLDPSRAYLPEPTDEAIAHAARTCRRLRPGPSSWPATACSGARAADELRAFAEGLHVPVAVTFMGKGAIDDRSRTSR